jgi:hypothetical protein
MSISAKPKWTEQDWCTRKLMSVSQKAWDHPHCHKWHWLAAINPHWLQLLTVGIEKHVIISPKFCTELCKNQHPECMSHFWKQWETSVMTLASSQAPVQVPSSIEIQWTMTHYLDLELDKIASDACFIILILGGDTIWTSIRVTSPSTRGQPGHRLGHGQISETINCWSCFNRAWARCYPPALDIICPCLLPANVQLAECLQNLWHYLLWMRSELQICNLLSEFLKCIERLPWATYWW